MWRFLLIIVLVFGFSITSWAEKKEVYLEEIMITATRVEEAIENIPASVTVITKEEIEGSTATNITEVLRDVVGLRVTEYGKKGAIALPRLRGSTAGQVLILLDGRRLNAPGSGQFNLNDLPLSLDDIERIEVLRGGSSALYGADALGGVINIITKRPERYQTTVRSSYGRFESELYSLTTSGKIKSFGYLISASKERSDGYRPNSSYDTNALNLKFGIDLTQRSSLDLSLNYLDKEAGVPGRITFPTPRANQTDEDTLLGITYTGEYSETFNVVTRVYRNQYKLAYRNPDRYEDSSHKDITTGGEIQLSYLYNPSNLFTGGIEIIREERDSTETGNRDRSRIGVFLQDKIKTGDSLTFIPGLRFDAFSPGQEKISPKISALYKIKDAGFRASVGRGYRIPTFNDLYWPDTYWSVGNPYLKPESSIEYEFGWDQTFRQNLNTRITIFRRDTRDLILWRPDPSFKWSPMNIGKARIEGIELEGEIDIHKFSSIDLNYTYLSPEDRLTGEKILYLPKHQIGSGLRVSVPFGLVLSIDGRYIKNYVKEGEPSSYFVADGRISQKIDIHERIKGEAFFGVKNIFDKDYETTPGYPMPPREIYGGISITF